MHLKALAAYTAFLIYASFFSLFSVITSSNRKAYNYNKIDCMEYALDHPDYLSTSAADLGYSKSKHIDCPKTLGCGNSVNKVTFGG